MITTGNSARYLDQVRFQPLPAAVVILADQQIARIKLMARRSLAAAMLAP